jgi:hypothetical protein
MQFNLTQGASRSTASQEEGQSAKKMVKVSNASTDRNSTSTESASGAGGDFSPFVGSRDVVSPGLTVDADAYRTLHQDQPRIWQMMVRG